MIGPLSVSFPRLERFMKSLRVVVAAVSLILGAAAAHAEDAPEDVLKAKGLTPQGAVFILEGDTALTKSMVEIRKLKGQADAARRESKLTEKKIDRAKEVIAEKEFQLHKLDGERFKAQAKDEYNRLIDTMNKLKLEIDGFVKEKQEKEKQVRTTLDKAESAFAEKVLAISQKTEETQAAYDALAKDADVAAALDKIKDGGKVATLGPSPAFVASRKFIATARAGIESGVVQLEQKGNILLVEVVINGKAGRSMVLDTGASAISLPTDVAKELGLVPGPADPTVRVSLADGKIVEAKQMKLDTVQVGQFKATGVICLVLPPELTNAPALLGNTFLKQFTFHIDPEKGTLQLTRIKEDDEKPAKK
jgi:clan AA aspartic protease (TIGR02281 family)